MFTYPFGLFGGTLLINITSDQTDLNLYTYAGSPAGARNVKVHIASGVVIDSSDASIPAFDTGAWPAGTTIYILNEGHILGGGGAGGVGGGATESPSCWDGSNGEDGGPAMNLQLDVIIENGSGNIWGGGGGGGGGGGHNQLTSLTFGGGGGGGGVGNGAGALGGNVSDYDGATGDTATTGVSAVPGGGGIGGNGNVRGNEGGDGATWATAGQDGVKSTVDGFTECSSNPGLGGAAGKAIELNSNSVTWISGFGSPNVNGAIG